MSRKDWGILITLVVVFLLAYFLNFASSQIQNAVLEAFLMLQWYARNHTLACVVPAMFIAGGIATFLSKEGVLRHLGPKANKIEAYAVASVSGTVLAVCSCSVLPMFAGIYRVGAGLGPAAAFLYSGPAINVMAIFLTARVLGFDLGLARVIGAVIFAVVIGLIMAWIFRSEETSRLTAAMALPESPKPKRRLWQNAVFLGSMIALLVFSDWSDPSRTRVELTPNTRITLMDGSQRTVNFERPVSVAVLMETTSSYRLQLEESVDKLTKGMKFNVEKTAVRSRAQDTPPGYELAAWVYRNRWYFAGVFLLLTVLMALGWFEKAELGAWLFETWSFSKQIIPLLFIGVFVTGFVGALLPEKVVGGLVGGNSIRANLVAAVIGSAWYFATLTEIPILEALIGLGMGKGPALSLLLAGPALSIPSIVVIYSVWGLKKTATFVVLIVILSALAGLVFGLFVT
ncbi:MAG: permease [Thermogutta sp.]